MALALGYARWWTGSRAVQGTTPASSTNATPPDSDGATNSAVSSLPPQAGADTNSASSAALGERTLLAALLSLLDTPNAGIRPKDVAGLGAESQGALIGAYHATDSIAKKARIARVLAHIGDERVLGLLTNPLTREYMGRQLTHREGQDLGQVAECLGFLARRYDSAFDFLKQGIDPAFWSQQPGPSGAYVSMRGFAADCLRGLAMSRRPEVQTILDTIRAESTPAVARNRSSSLVTAAYSYRMQQQYGDAWDNGEVYRVGDFEADMRRFEDWSKTPEGLDWRRWSRKAQGIPEPRVTPPRARP